MKKKINHYRDWLAIWLNRKTAYWNRASKIIALVLFCLLFGGIFTYLIINAL